MADNGSRSFRRDEYSRDGGAQQDASQSDPLAELARLIGQSEGYGGGMGRASAQTYDETTPLPELDWAAGEQQYAQHDAGAGNGYPPPAADQYRDERAPAPRYTPPAGFGEPQSEYAEHDGYYQQSQPQPGPPSLPFISPLNAGEEQDADRSHGRLTPAYASDTRDDYDDHAGSSSRRRGTVIALGILGVVVLGTAGAFGYHAMFGGSFIPSLPPIIKPGNTPVKIVPKKDAQAAPGNQTTVAKGEQLVPHQETPVEVQPANPPPRVVTTIPVISNAPVAPVQGAVPPAGPPPAAAPALPAAPSGPAQPIAPPDQLSGPGPASGSKPVHTVIIKPQQAGSSAPTGTAAAVRPVKPHPPVTKPASRTAAAGGPLSIIPGQQDSAPQSPPPPRTHTAMSHPGGPMPLNGSAAPEAPAARAGGYAVQVSSQRSEGEAQAAFRSLQAKYPRELGSRHAEFRRADLGAKGIYYRALVGPFGSAEEASSVCRSLKAAGGSCIVQRN